ncbi:Tc toxin subunit A [Pseudomonas lijiangensis]|uniref:Tc toxin subunit A n=1 Tax=Pseudomonas lijiangensis TaxID=2995658 RepID=UPI0034D97345
MTDQPFSLLRNLAKAEASPPERTDGKVAFVSALQEMGITSVFDIVRRSKPAFVRELARLSDANGELAYENARCYATQIVRLYRNQLVSSGRTQSITRRTGVRSLVDIGPSFPNLFKENWDLFCKVGAIEAKDSPAAYLTSLYRFAREELEGSTPETNRISLEDRRPDLKDLLIDQQSTFTPVPTLQIVNQVLSKAIDTYVDTVEADKDKTIYQLVAEKKHPFLFPYNFHHQQIMLGLGGKKPRLGELSYRISLEVPATSAGTSAYGALQHNSSVAQVMMSGFSPEQQALVLAPALPLEPPPAETADDARDDQEDLLTITRFFKASYGVSYIQGAANALDSLKVFIEKTGLNSDAVEAVLAVHNHAPYESPNVLPAGHSAIEPQASAVKYGACYVNGPSDQAPLGLSRDDKGNARLINTSVDRFDRLQRMIRLQRWMDIPFAKLDTLIMAVIRSEGEANTGQVLTLNTLRTLGTYRYLSKHYSIEPEEFAGLFHQLSAYASNRHLPMYDQAFNYPVVFDTPLVLDGKDVWLTSGDSLSNKTLAQICMALGLEYTRESLWPILVDTRNAYADADKPFKRTLSMLSSMYRQTRIASMLDIPAPSSRALVDLLGGESYRNQIVKGVLKAPETLSDDTTPDILDILMQLEWAVSWLNETGRDVWTLRRQLGIDPSESTLPQSLLDQLDQLGKDASATALAEEQLAPLNLPIKDDGGTAIDWWGTVLSPLVESHGLVKALPLVLDDNASAAIDKLLVVQIEPLKLGADAKEAARTSLGEFVFKGYVVQHRLVEGLLQSNAGLPLDRCETVMRWAGTSADAFLGKVLDASAPASFSLPLAASSQEVIDSLMTLLRYAEVNQELGLSAQALRTFLVHPQWLHASFAAPLPLSLASFHVLDRYRNWRDSSGHPEAALLSYFVLANTDATASQWAARLALLMDWSSTEIGAASELLANRIGKSMHQIDWLRRMHGICTLTGLGTAQLLAATALTSDSTTDEWKKVGDAVMGASR